MAKVMDENNTEKDMENGNVADKTDKKSKKKDEEADEPVIGFIQYYRYSTPYDWLLISIGVLFAAFKGLSWPGIMIIFGEMIESLGTSSVDEVTSSMMGFAWWYIGVGFFQILAGYLASAFINITAERQATKIRKAYFQAMLRQEIGWYDTMSSGELTTRLTGDVEKIRDGLSDKSGLFAQWLLCFISGIAIAFYYSWRLSLVIMATAPLLGGTSAIFAKMLADFAATELSAYAAAGAVAEEVIGAIRTVVSFGGENKEVDRYRSKLDVTVQAGNKNQLLYGLSLALTYAIMYFTYALAFWYGAKLTGELTTDPAAVIISFFNIMIGAWGLGFCAPQWKVMSVGRGAALKVYTTIDRVSEINHEDKEGLTLPNFEGRLQFKNCSFHYPTRPDVQVMKDFNLLLEPGKTHALVGPSGCGKSTAVQLIERFYDVLSGQISIDDKNITDLNLRWLRDQIGLVGQEPVLFSCSIEDNIRYGREGVSKEDIVAASKLAFAHDFISKLPAGYDTLCGERGGQMSGGQKQRIAIARALVRDPKILLLDEATSALDNKSEKIVQQALDKAREGRTTLIIAHRLSTIKDADKICAISDGKIVEEGTHDELMKLEGVYHSLVTYQQAVQDQDNEAMALPEKLPTSLEEIKRAISSPDGLRKRKDTVKSQEEEEVEVGIVEPGSEEDVKPATFWEIFRECSAYEYLMIGVGSVGAAVNGVTMPVFAVLFASVLFDLINLSEAAKLKAATGSDAELDYGPTNKWALYFALLGVVTGVFYFLQVYCMGIMSESFTRRLRIRSFKALLRQNLAFFDEPRNSIGALTTRLSTEANCVKDATGPRIATIIQVVVGMTAGVIIAFTSSWKLALVCLACVPFIVVAGIVQMWQVTGTTKGVAKLYEESGKTAAESIENMRTVASLGLENMFYKHYTEALRLPLKASEKKAHIIGFCMGLSEAITFFTFAAVFGYGSVLLKDGESTFDEVMEVFSAIIFSAMIVGEAMSYLGDYTKATMSAGKILKLIYDKPAIDAYSDEGLNNFTVSGELKFTDVKFNYPTRPNQPVLQDLTFSALPGQTVALVGQSGCGKSTTIQLTERFYDGLSGTIHLDNHELCDINVSYLRQQLGLVSQEPILFDSSIADNIKYGDLTRTISDEEMIAVAKSANIHDFISSLPEGYKTHVGEKGSQLSGGQKQRVAIARALVRNPKILLLDEATSALDTESEKIVQEALDRARQGRTCIVIAHRLSTIHTADLICVIDEGKVVEQGTHQELMGQRGIYFNLNTKTD